MKVYRIVLESEQHPDLTFYYMDISGNEILITPDPMKAEVYTDPEHARRILTQLLKQLDAEHWIGWKIGMEVVK